MLMFQLLYGQYWHILVYNAIAPWGAAPRLTPLALIDILPPIEAGMEASAS